MTRLSSTLDSVTLKEVRDWLRGRVDAGEKCPCCGQMAKVYRRSITGSMARSLIELYKESNTQFGFAPEILRLHNMANDFAKLRYWGILEAGDSTGWWRVTELGEQWLRGEVTVPSHARVYNSSCLGLTGDQVSISDRLGYIFDFNELWAANG